MSGAPDLTPSGSAPSAIHTAQWIVKYLEGANLGFMDEKTLPVARALIVATEALAQIGASLNGYSPYERSAVRKEIAIKALARITDGATPNPERSGT